MTTVRLPAKAGARSLLAAALCAATVTACGSTAAPAATSGASKPKVSLHVTVTSSSSRSRQFTLQCDPAGGTHADPARACRILLAAKDPFVPLRKGVMCPMIIAGSKHATVDGTYFGRHVHMTIFDGGCYLQRWAQIGQIFN
ncbi:MAG: SSI family serine proteinase inhibitor [Streptosporangiaceae bacterium]